MERQHLWGNPPDDSDESWWPGAKRPADEALGPSSFSSNLSNPQREPRESSKRLCGQQPEQQPGAEFEFHRTDAESNFGDAICVNSDSVSALLDESVGLDDDGTTPMPSSLGDSGWPGEEEGSAPDAAFDTCFGLVSAGRISGFEWDVLTCLFSFSSTTCGFVITSKRTRRVGRSRSSATANSSSFET